MRLRNYVVAVAAIALSGLAMRAASAAPITFTASGSGGDGPDAATVSFTAVTGGIKITITNTETGTFSIGQGVSSLTFGVSGLSTPSAFTEVDGVSYSPSVSGYTWSLSDGTAFDNVGSGPVIDHWGFSTSGSTTQLATAGSPVSGSSPYYLIFPGTGTVGPAGSLAGNHVPDIIGPADFFLTVSGVTANTVLTSSEFTNVNIGFGTGPDNSFGATYSGGGGGSSPPTPLPASVWGGAALIAGLACVRRVMRKHG